MPNISLQKPNYEFLERICKKRNKTIEYLMHQLIIYPDLTERFLELPSEITNVMKTAAGTINELLPLWINNLRNNFEAIKAGKDIRDIPPPAHPKNSPALVIGAGPSQVRRNHLKLLAEKPFHGTIFATDRILKSCLEQGIIPNYILILDGSDKILKFIDHGIVDRYANSIGAIMCTVTHPSVVKRWQGEIFWFNNNLNEQIIPNVGLLLNLLCKKTELATAGHSSSIGWSAAISRGYNPIVLIGLDLSYPVDIPIEKTQYYDRYVKILNNDLTKIQAFYTHGHHNFFNTDYYYDTVFGAYLASSMSHFRAAAQRGIKIINCTEGGAIEGKGVACMRFTDYLNSQGEKEK